MPTEKSHLKPQKCKYCTAAATKSILHSEGMAYIPTCDAHLAKGRVAAANCVPGDKPDPTNIDKVYDLADAEVSSTDTMVALMLPKDVASKIAVDGGVPVEDMHITLTFHGEVDDDAFKALVDAVRSAVSDHKALSGTIGGIGTFPADDTEKGAPWWVPVDVPGINALFETVRAATDLGKSPAMKNHGYCPHSTLTYVKDGETPPSPVPSTPVTFPSVWVVRGNEDRVELPLGQSTSADSTERGTLGESDPNVELSEESLNVLDLAERAKSIGDPELKKKVMGQILDLALTKDGRKSFKKQGKWKHGFVPVDEPAVVAKAKGSPIARKRIERLYGNKRGQAGPAKKAASGRLTVKTEGGEITASRAGLLQGAKTPDIKSSHRVKNSQFEKNKVGRVKARATRPWDSIPDAAKTVRNGKRFVVSTYKGKQVLTEWQGEVREQDMKNTTRYITLTTADAAKMSTAQLRKILKTPTAGKQAKQMAYKTLQAKIKAGKAPTR